MPASEAIRFDLPAKRNESGLELRKTISRSSRKRSLSQDRKTATAAEDDISIGGCEDGPEVREGDFKERQV